jgi:hypothetical protein
MDNNKSMCRMRGGEAKTVTNRKGIAGRIANWSGRGGR